MSVVSRKSAQIFVDVKYWIDVLIFKITACDIGFKFPSPRAIIVTMSLLEQTRFFCNTRDNIVNGFNYFIKLFQAV